MKRTSTVLSGEELQSAPIGIQRRADSAPPPHLPRIGQVAHLANSTEHSYYAIVQRNIKCSRFL